MNGNNGLQQFGIFSPILGLRKDMPSVFIDKLATPYCSNMRLHEGVPKGSMKPQEELVESEFSTGLVDVLNGNATITLAAAATHFATAATNKPDWTGRTIKVTHADTTVHTCTIASVADAGTSVNISDVGGYPGANENNCSYVIGTANQAVATPDGNPIIHYHTLERGTTIVEYVFAFTKRNAYLWSDTWSAWMLKFASGSDISLWDTVSYKQFIIATNNVDTVLYWPKGGTTTDDLEELDVDGSGPQITAGAEYITKAKFVTTYENYIILGAVTETTAGFCPNRIRWCDLSPAVDTTGEWNSGDAGAADVPGAGEFEGGFGQYRNWLIVLKSASIKPIWLGGSSDIFEIGTISDHIGCKAPHSVVNDKEGMLYFFASDYTFRDINLNEISKPIDVTVKYINPLALDRMVSCFSDELSEIHWAIARGGGQTTNGLLLKCKAGRWMMGEPRLGIGAFGKYSKISATVIDNFMPSTLIDNIPFLIDSTISRAGSPVELCSDAFSGYTYAKQASYLDSGVAFTRDFQIATDMANKQGLGFYKHLVYIDVFLSRNSLGDLTLMVSSNLDSDTQGYTVTVSGNNPVFVQRIGTSVRARDFKILLYATHHFELLGYILHYAPMGDR